MTIGELLIDNLQQLIKEEEKQKYKSQKLFQYYFDRITSYRSIYLKGDKSEKSNH